MESKVYNNEGKEVGKVMLPEGVFAAPWNADLVHQVVVSMQSNARIPFAHTKNRGEVSGTGRKPWRQKGTGRARHGSRRSPIWVGGGVAHGPRNEKSYTKKINTKMRAQALFSVLSKKLKDNEIIFVDALSLEVPKTKMAKGILEKLGGVEGFKSIVSKKKNAALVALATKSEGTTKSFRNIGNVTVGEVRNLNPVDVLSNRYLVLVGPDESIKMLESRIAKGGKKVAPKVPKAASKTTAKRASKKLAPST